MENVGNLLAMGDVCLSLPADGTMQWELRLLPSAGVSEEGPMRWEPQGSALPSSIAPAPGTRWHPHGSQGPQARGIPQVP